MKGALLVLRILLAGVFLYAGFVKASSSAQFALALVPFTLLPSSWISPLALALPLVEIAGGILLLLPWTRRAGAIVLLGLCLVFISALAWALGNDLIVSCSCFGREETPSAQKMLLALLRDVGLAGLALMAFFEKELLRRLSRTRDNFQKTPGSA